MNPTENRTDRSYAVTIPADLDRPDRILGGLSARQLSILTTGGLTAWIVEGLLEPLVGLPAAVTLAAPPALVATDGIPTTPAWAGPRGPRVAPLDGPVHGLDPVGMVDLGRQGWALVCQATPVNLSLRTPAEQQALLASFARLLHALTGLMQVLVRSDCADLTPLVTTLQEQAAALPHPGLEQAALAYGRWLDTLPGDREVRRRQLLVVFHQPPHATNPAGVLLRQAEQAAGLLAAAGVTLTPLGGEEAAQVLHAVANPDSPPRPAGLAPPAAIISGRPA